MSRMGLYPMKIDKEFLSFYAFKHLKSNQFTFYGIKKRKYQR